MLYYSYDLSGPAYPLVRARYVKMSTARYKRERQEKWEWGLTITRDELENELAGRCQPPLPLLLSLSFLPHSSSLFHCTTARYNIEKKRRRRRRRNERDKRKKQKMKMGNDGKCTG